MSTSLISLEPEQSIGQLVEYLEMYPRLLDYPVIDSSRGGIFLGVVTKQDILTLLTHRELFYEPQKRETSGCENTGDGNCDVNGDANAVAASPVSPPQRGRSDRVALKFENLIYERVKKIETDLETVLSVVTDEDREKMVLDITPYIEIGHYTVNRYMSVHRTFELFRSLGLRDLIVTDACGRPLGVITRHDLKLLEEVGMEEEQYVQRPEEIDVSYR